MSTFDFEMGNEISTALTERPQSIMDKERELSELLDHVMQAPLAPLHKILENLDEMADISKDRLDDIFKFVQINGDDLESIKRRVHTIETILTRLDDLESGLSLAFADTAKASALTEIAGAALRRDQTILDALVKVGEEAQKAALDAAKRGQRLVILISVVLAAILGDIMTNIFIHIHG